MQHENDNQPGELLLGATAIAACLGITRRQAYRLVYSGEIPTFKLGGSVAARRSSLAKWLENLEAAAA